MTRFGSLTNTAQAGFATSRPTWDRSGGTVRQLAASPAFWVILLLVAILLPLTSPELAGTILPLS
jgi:hypothetical protein